MQVTRKITLSQLVVPIIFVLICVGATIVGRVQANCYQHEQEIRMLHCPITANELSLTGRPLMVKGIVNDPNSCVYNVTPCDVDGASQQGLPKSVVLEPGWRLGQFDVGSIIQIEPSERKRASVVYRVVGIYNPPSLQK